MYLLIVVFPIGSVVKIPPANVGMWLQFLGQKDSFEKEMANSSILAWKTQWTEEPDGIQFMRLKRASHDLATKQQHI